MAVKRVIIINAGQGGKSLIELFHHNSTIDLLGVADVNKNAPGFLLAKKYGIFATQNFTELLKFPSIDLIIDVTGNSDIFHQISQLKEIDTELVSGTAARFIWELIETKKQTQDLEDHYKLAIRALESNTSDEFIIGQNPQMLEVRGLIAKVAPTPTTVLIGGESGTGKELVARAIHSQSSRSHLPMVTLNCTALPSTLLESELFGYKKGSFTGAYKDTQGLFERAHGSTMFLDEIGDMSLETQAKLLRTLQTGEIRAVGDFKNKNVDVRIIAATNRELVKLIRERRFREDLFYRVNTFTINLPPLRERIEDLPQLAEYFLKRACARINKRIDRISPPAMSLLAQYRWAGNLREMQNVIESAVIMAASTVIEPENISFPLQDSRLENQMSQNLNFMDAKAKAVEKFERQALTHYLAESKGNVSKAAELAELPRRTFHRLMEKHAITSPRHLAD
ncbi:MAG: sigma-54 dependent transcriptional regulator [Acidobacteriota bacterium]|nr:sigma-54 dependent transcriptional regulator [Acidobacteriota bacterium]